MWSGTSSLEYTSTPKPMQHCPQPLQVLGACGSEIAADCWETMDFLFLWLFAVRHFDERGGTVGGRRRFEPGIRSLVVHQPHPGHHPGSVVGLRQGGALIDL